MDAASNSGFSHEEVVELSKGVIAEAKLNEVVAPTEAAKPVPQPKLTAKQIGQLRRLHITVVHGTVTACGHKVKFDEVHMPTNNCVDCWTAYFMTNVDLEGIHIVLTKKGVRALTALKGTKFVKMFHGFLSSKLLPMLKAETEQLVPADPTVIVGGINGGNGSTEASNQGTEICSNQSAVEADGHEAQHNGVNSADGQHNSCTHSEHTAGPADSGL
jgi:hypothetical protein